MDDPTEDNRRGVLSAAQHAHLSAQPKASSWWARHVRAQWAGTNLAQLVTKSPEGLAADLADRRVVSADATLGLEPVPSVVPPMLHWVARLDDGQALALAPGVYLPPGRQRLYFLPRSRWVVHGEARPEQWQDYRALVLQAQRLEPAEVDALRAGRLPPRYGAQLRSRVRAWWIPALSWVAWSIGAGTTGAGPTWENLAFAALLGMVALWGARRLWLVHRDVSRGAITFVDGPVHIDIVLGRFQANYALVVGGVRFQLSSSGAALVPTLQECTPCRLYHAPASRLFVAIEPLA